MPRQADRACGRGLLLNLGRSPGTLVFQRRSFTIPNIQISRSRFARYARRTRTRNWTSQLTPTRVTRPKMLRSFGSKKRIRSLEDQVRTLQEENELLYGKLSERA